MNQQSPVCSRCGEHIATGQSCVEPGFGFNSFHEACWKREQEQIHSDHIEADSMSQQRGNDLVDGLTF